ncbi:Di-copper centre-containing protein [Trametes cingulata]|nr:Di-copper centre-containing protein [Trametes cingulata]
MSGYKHIVTAGVVGPPGKPVFDRLEITEFMKNEKQYSLFVQALLFFMRGELAASRKSYWQIAGIHGAPNVEYDDSGEPLVPPPEFKGYCTHNSVLFPTWHRVYMALMEQEIQRLALMIAQTRYDDAVKAEWIDAAIALRHPYWDWSLYPLPPGDLYKTPELQILLPPHGTLGPSENPFYTYQISQPPVDFPPPFDEPLWQTMTHRHGNVVGGAVMDDLKGMEMSLRGGFSNRRNVTSLLLSGSVVNTWAKFSADVGGILGSASLEALHNTIHLSVGGGQQKGHMSAAGVAAFDPFFWLHHSQTDRLMSLWVALHPDVWVSPSKEVEGTWTLANNAPVDVNTPLTPFYFSADPSQDPTQPFKNVWTSADLQGPTEGLLGYSYPEFDGIDLSNKDAVKEQIRLKVEALYPIIAPTKTWLDFDAGASQPPLDAARRLHFRAVLHWSAHISVKKNALQGSFIVLIFLGSVPFDPKDYASSPNLVGDYSAFVNSEPSRCGNCVRLGDITVGGAVSLNDAIMEKAEVKSFHPDEIVPYLRRQLKWRVHTGSGPAVHPNDVDGLQVHVSAAPFYLGEDDSFEAGEPEAYHEVTRGLPGGCAHSDSDGSINA